DKLVKPAIQAVKKDKIKFYPKRYKKIYLDWMENIDDWCISRQLWWGHKIPIKGETDVLDTWFSSALWPFAILGWPEKTQDMKDFYPTTLLSTDKDIIYLWVARMIFSSLEFLKTIPFTDVYIHSTVLNIEGKRMSKSLGTGIDPLELIEKYGADATRFGLMYITSLEQQQIRFSENTAKTSRNFANKLFNINRFIKEFLDKPETKKPKTLADKWIISKLNTLIKNTTNNIKEYKLGEASREIYDFVWHDYADWYVEISKQQDKSLNKEIFETILKLLHPFMPFITEHLYNDKKNPLIISNWPKHNEKLIDKKTEKEFEKIQNKIIEKRKENIKLQDLIKEFL
ncbi:MAG: class I tRNA ligase family protein, partial [Patescibacteria group bacterium]